MFFYMVVNGASEISVSSETSFFFYFLLNKEYDRAFKQRQDFNFGGYCFFLTRIVFDKEVDNHQNNMKRSDYLSKIKGQ